MSAIVTGLIVTVCTYCAMGVFFLPAVNLFSFEQRGLDAVGFAVVPVSCGLLAGYAVWRHCTSRARTNDYTCPVCGYDLTGNLTGRCSECGTLIGP